MINFFLGFLSGSIFIISLVQLSHFAYNNTIKKADKLIDEGIDLNKKKIILQSQLNELINGR